MSLIFGVYHKLGSPIDVDAFDRAMKSIGGWNPDKTGILINGNIGFGNHLMYTTHESKNENLPNYIEKSNCLITADVRLDYREELGEQLGVSLKAGNNITDSQLLFLAYSKWGEDCPKYLFGDYAFAIWNEQTQELFCARDHFGCRPFYYYDNEDVFIFSSDLKVFSSNLNILNTLDKDWLTSCLAQTNPEKSISPIESVFRLEPSCFLKTNKVETKKYRYWELSKSVDLKHYSDEQLVEEFRNKLIESIKNKLRSAYPIGTELSGGLDSSGITAIAAQLCEDERIPIFSFSHVMPKELFGLTYPFSDESEKIKKVSDHIPYCKNIQVLGTDKGVLKAIKENLMQLGYPVVKGYSVMCDQLYKQASQKDVRILLSGFGGDQGVTSQAQVFFNELATGRNWKALIEELKKYSKNKSKGRFFLLKRIAFYLLLEYFPFSLMPIRNRKKRIYEKRYNILAINKGAEEELEIRKKYFKIFCKEKSNNLRDQLKENIEDNFMSLRLEDTSLTAQHSKIEYRYPLLDVKLLEFYFNLPSRLKFKDGIGRYIYRKAMEDILPSGFCWDIDKGGSATVPNVQYRLKLDLEQIYEIVEEGKNGNEIHYVDYQKLDAIILMILSRDKGKSILITANHLFSYLRILILQKWQREGRIKTGIDIGNRGYF